MLINFKNHKFCIILIFFFILNACKLQEPTKNHGILFLENRSNQLKIKNNNKNDVIKIIGNPHTKSIDKNDWIYVKECLERNFVSTVGNYVNEFEDEWVSLLKQYYYVDTILRANGKLWMCNEIPIIDYEEIKN